jgi:RNA polymerase sigma factor (sigma-70 family)
LTAKPSSRSLALPPFQALLDEHGSDVLGFLTASVGPSDADDVYQETFIAALRAYPKLEHADNLRGWLLTIAHRKAIDHHRKRTPVPVEHAAEMADAAGEATPPPNANGIDPGIWSNVASLPDKQRSAVVLRFAADLPYREIGERIDCSEEAARRNVHEGIKQLRKELA